MVAERQSSQRERRGVVVSDKMDKTIVVEVSSAKPHPLYKKIVRRSNKLKAHDEQNEARIGDTVLVRESRPLSKTKSWRLISILERAE
jgi:small subunit ribosomal protein S17